MKQYKTEFVQPLGKHNKPCDCVLSSEIKEYIQLPYPHLNPLQSMFVPFLEEDEKNIVVAAPTSSGKTLIAELFAARAISLGKKVLYIAPMKALADEKYEDWRKVKHTFSKYKIEILTGDFELSNSKKKQLNDANIITLTPEMFDAKCRNIQNHTWLHNSVLIMDEAHCIGMKGRGDSVEIGITRYYENDPSSRCLLLSATLPNVKDLAIWLKTLTNRDTLVLKSDYRPCTLTKHWVPISIADKSGRRFKNYQDIEAKRREKVIELVEDFGNESVIVFVGSKDFGKKLSHEMEKNGIKHAFHNADLKREKRKVVEQEFLSGENKVLIATSTMAWGCFTGDTQVLTENGYEEIATSKSKPYSTYPCDSSSPIVSDFHKKIVTGNKIPMVKITLENGFSVTCTEDHVFPVKISRDKSAADLEINDCLFVFENEKELQQKYSKIVKKEKVEIEDIVFDLSIKRNNYNYYIVNGILAHNCNTPARYVIQSHTSFGLTPMHPANIIQSIGRAGRAGWSDKGDAYILVPEHNASSVFAERKRITQDYNIESTLIDESVLAFHILAYINDGTISNVEDINNWYKKTLAFLQHNELGDLSEKVLMKLKVKKMIKEDENGNCKVTRLGAITARNYMCPMDVYDWFCNFSRIVDLNPKNSDHFADNINIKTALALSICNSYGCTNDGKWDEKPEHRKNPEVYLTAIERETPEVRQLAQRVGIKNPEDHVYLKYTSVFYSLLSGKEDISPELYAYKMAIQKDSSRIISVLKQIDSQMGRAIKKKGGCIGYGFGDKEWDQLELRLKYCNIHKDLIPLVEIEGIGKKTAEKLFAAGIRSKEDILNGQNAGVCMNIMKDKKYEKTVKQLQKQ